MTNQRILITGACGLIGTALTGLLRERGDDVTILDINAPLNQGRGDVRDAHIVRESIKACDGVIHLAAVSRVITGEQNPSLCRQTNINGLKNVLASVATSPRSPWLIFASSREVYGQPDILPATEDSPLKAMNVYGHTKVEGERLIEAARRAKIRACTVRLSNVYGSTRDHFDRVVPAFVRGAVQGQELRVDGAGHTFDFTYIDDVAAGICMLAELLGQTLTPPEPIHFVTGAPTTLDELAKLSIHLAKSNATIRYAPSRDFDVGRFFGDPSRAKNLLGWSHKTHIKQGLNYFIGTLELETKQSGIITTHIRL